MELVFLALLVLFMVIALTSGFPVAFALPGSAILAIALAALSGYLFAGDMDAYFAQDGPVQWLSAGVTNFRSLYWDVERDTLIAIPLFVFMGIMLERSKIAEDLLVTMAQLFGPIPGGLGISVVFVGALLAATTGIVGATVIAMGLISLPAMLRNNYSKPLATGTICASGTLGQIIPPSIVLIILADQLSSATDQASTARKAEYTAATGEFSMPSAFDVVSASAGDMFMGAFVPGLILVVIYMAYILVSALLRPHTAPPVPYDGKFDRGFALRVLLALVPPLTLIFVVLGSIIMGVATVNQAGAIGAIGAMIMGGYRLRAGKRNAYYPAILAVISTAAIMIILNFFDLNIKNITSRADAIGIVLAMIAVVGLLIAVAWSAWRSYKIEDTLSGVMIETAKTTSMVFIILIGAAMLTSAFRAFGGEELVKEFLQGLPGGFWAQFIVVMGVIFLLGFFLDFIEIAVVVVPIIAPILLADPSANVTAVWLGVMIGLNIQTSFLTPPFGFALFYLRGVAPPSVKTLQIYRGAAAFIVLQLVALVIAGYFPALVNYLPARIYLTSETAPPPMNPRLQQCMENIVFDYYDNSGDSLRTSVKRVQSLNLDVLPNDLRKPLEASFSQTLATFDLVAEARKAKAALGDYAPQYRPLHQQVRRIQAQVRSIDKDLEKLAQDLRRAGNNEQEDVARRVEKRIERLQTEKSELEESIPGHWEAERARYVELDKAHQKAISVYRRNVDGAYEPVRNMRILLSESDALVAVDEQLMNLAPVIANEPIEQAMATIKETEQALDEISGVSKIKSRISKARRALKRGGDRDKAADFLRQGLERYQEEVAWRSQAMEQLGAGLTEYEDALRSSVGLRLQERLTTEQAKSVANCQASHQDISLSF